jgi:hypothetical protein
MPTADGGILLLFPNYFPSFVGPFVSLRPYSTSISQDPCRGLLLSVLDGVPLRRLRFDPWSVHVVLVVDKVALGEVFSEYLGFPYQFSFHHLHIHHHIIRAGTIGPVVANEPSGFSLIQRIVSPISSSVFFRESSVMGLPFFSLQRSGLVNNDKSYPCNRLWRSIGL